MKGMQKSNLLVTARGESAEETERTAHKVSAIPMVRSIFETEVNRGASTGGPVSLHVRALKAASPESGWDRKAACSALIAEARRIARPFGS